MSIEQLFFFPPIYMAPTIAAIFFKRRASSLLDIGLTNLLLGWTYIGWAFAWLLLIYSPRPLLSSTAPSRPPIPATS